MTACIAHTGREAAYQSDASAAYYIERDLSLMPLEWVSTTCGERCLNVDHMRITPSVRLAYPYGVCVYCGQRAGTKDHLIPRAWSGETARRGVAVVPACGECNGVLSDVGIWSINARRAVAHIRLMRKHRRVLAYINYSPEELDEFGPGLRSSIEEGAARKADLLERLDWPLDPGFDLRACERAGFGDPYAVGLLAHPDDAERDSQAATRPRVLRDAAAPRDRPRPAHGPASGMMGLVRGTT